MPLQIQEAVGAVNDVESSPEVQYLADASVMNRYLKVPRVFMTTGVCLVLANTFGMDLNEDEDGHKKIFMSLFALTMLEMDVWVCLYELFGHREENMHQNIFKFISSWDIKCDDKFIVDWLHR